MEGGGYGFSGFIGNRHMDISLVKYPNWNHEISPLVSPIVPPPYTTWFSCPCIDQDQVIRMLCTSLSNF